jgi:hypothetical protein
MFNIALMDKENIAYIHSGVLFSHKEQNHAAYRKMDGTGDHHVRRNEPASEETQVSHVFSHMWQGPF